MSTPIPDPELETRITDLVIRLGALATLLYAAFMMVRPLLGILSWAVVLTVALLPLHNWLTSRLGGRATLSAAVITLVALAIVLGPLAALLTSVVDSGFVIAQHISTTGLRLPDLPPAISALPVIGTTINSIWTGAATNLEATITRLGPDLMPHAAKALSAAAGFGMEIFRFVASVILVGPMLRFSERLAGNGRRLAQRIAAPSKGERAVDLAIASIRGVSRGVVGVALIQALLAGMVMVLAGVPGAGLLAFLILIFCIVQIGMIPVTLPLLIWAWLSMPFGHALFLTIGLVPVSLVDNVLKPLLMSRGTEIPALVMLVGVICGTIAAGLIGIFLGPIILVLVYDLVLAWTTDDVAGEDQSPKTSA